jgi:threonyl-tRNA synthetase
MSENKNAVSAPEVDARKAEKLGILRHSTSHVMAQAVQNLFSGVKVAIGPSIENGFYYDFKFPSPITAEDLPKIEAEMKRIINSKQDFVRVECSRDEALKRFADEQYKTELIGEIPDGETISIYENRDTDGKCVYADFCRGPHVANTRELNSNAFKLMSIAGAYWRGDEKRDMLTRIYGTAWETPKELKQYLAWLAECEKRDHRRIAKELDLFHIEPDDPGEIFWHPNGWTIFLILQNYVRGKIYADGYLEVNTPFIMPKSIYEKSGHWGKYNENMFTTETEKRQFAIKPMNCPGAVEIFKSQTRSYRDLPLRLAEFGWCTRCEPSGTLHGMLRVRGFVQDDAHIFCTEEQIGSEAKKFCALLYDIYEDFGFNRESVKVKLSTRPEKRVGTDEQWDKAEKALAEACGEAGVKYEINPGEGAFYGPKLEFTLVDALKREWQCGTFQLDYQMPSKDRLDAEYIGEDGAKHNPVLLHRAVLGSLERFIGILLENFGGALPVWLHFQQVAVIPVAPAFNEYAQRVAGFLSIKGFRAVANLDTDRMNAKIRLAQSLHIPYMLVVGDKEQAAGTVAIRLRDGTQKEPMSVIDFAVYLEQKVRTLDMDL